MSCALCCLLGHVLPNYLVAYNIISSCTSPVSPHVIQLSPLLFFYSFFFLMRIDTTANSPGCETNNLPYTLNTMHFLGYEGTMNFQAENWRIPSLSFATFHNINFTVPSPSLIHIYTEPHTVDIDIKILSASGGVRFSFSPSSFRLF
jgi:hypothetical protein